MDPSSPTSSSGSPAPLSPLVRVVAAVRTFPALLSHLFTCIADTVAIGTFMFAVTLSASGLLYTALAIVMAITLPAPSRWRTRATLGSRDFAIFAGACVVALVCAFHPAAGEHVSALPFTLGAGLVMRATRAYRSRVTGHREWRAAPLTWVVLASIGSFMTTSNFLFLVLVALAVHYRGVLRALVARGRPGWIHTAVAAAVVVAFVSMPATFHPVPAECLDSTRTARPASTEGADVVTVALLGDSSTQGILLPPTMTYAARLERLLNAAAPPRPYRVVNCSFSGAGSFHLPEQLLHAFAYRPAVVVVYMGDNDEWIHGSYEPTLLRPRYSARLGDVVEQCRARGIRPILLTPPSGRPWGFEWAEDMQFLTNEVGFTKGAEVIDIEGVIRDRPVPAYYFVADLAHPNSPGHALIARMLAERILKGAPIEPAAPAAAGAAGVSEPVPPG